MVYRKFVTGIVLHVFFIVVNALTVGWAFTKPNLNLFIVSILIILVVQALMLFRYVTKGNESLHNFLVNLRDNPSALDFIDRRELLAYKGIEGTLKDIFTIIQKARFEKEQNYQFVKGIVDSVEVGVVVWNQNNEVLLHNKKTLSLLHLSSIKSYNDFKRVSQEFVEKIQLLQPGNTSTYTFAFRGGVQTLSLKKSFLKLGGDGLYILAIEDIGRAVEQAEVTAWKKLVSIITHEIVNSISPIKSLSNTIVRSVKRAEVEGLTSDIKNKCIDAALAIEQRSSGIEGFISVYKSFYKLPMPVLRRVKIGDVVQNVKPIVNELVKLTNVSIVWKVDPKVELVIDERLISQVLINLVKNAAEAIGEAEGSISIECYADSYKNVFISVENNGPPIPAELMDRIFVPFFSTKENGSGIGLSISRQIMMMHGGGLSCSSNSDRHVKFVLAFG